MNELKNIDTPTGYELITGVELKDGSLIFLAIPSGKSSPSFVNRSNTMQWSEGLELPLRIAGATVNRAQDAMSAIDEAGTIIRYRPNEGARFALRKEDPKYRGQAIRFIHNFNGYAVTGGMDYYVYITAQAGDPWTEVTTPEMLALEEPAVRGFEDAAKLGDTVYFVGWAGAIWSYENGVWIKHDSPTNLMLGAAVANETANCVFAAGKIGTILKGKGDTWEKIEHDLTDLQIYSAATYKDATYFSGSFGIVKWHDGTLTMEKPVDDSFRSAGKELFVGPSGLWSVGASTLALYDGVSWEVVLETSR